MSSKKTRSSSAKGSSHHAFRDEDRVGFNAYPEELPIYLSHTNFPTSVEAYAALDLPLGMITRPFITNVHQHNYKSVSNVSKAVKEIARCDHCGAYINSFCDVNQGRWFCALCSRRNTYLRNQLRYKHIDSRLLPELRELLIDYNAPVKEDKDSVQYAIPIEQRPLIHIFLIQEDMHVDTLQTVIDAVNAATATIHPDIHVILMTFSYRIGMYSLHGDNPHAGVQYIHFLDQKSGQCLESILEDNPLNKIDMKDCIVFPSLADHRNFKDSACPIGECRDSLGACLSSILDGMPNNNDPDASHPNSTLFKTLDAIQAWIRGNPSLKANKATPSLSSSSVAKVQSNEEVGLNAFDFSKIWSLLSNTTTTEQSSFNHAHINNSHKDDFITENEYSGILLHVFVDRIQHQANSPSSTEMNQLIQEFCRLSVNVNMWSVCSFDSHETGGYFWNDLMTKTGGMLHRHTLGVTHTQDERLHLTQQLIRKLTTPYATKCQMKIRTPSNITVLEDGRSGLFHHPSSSHDVYHIPVVSPDTSYGFQFALNSHTNTEAAAIQVVFSYETIVEDQQETTHDHHHAANQDLDYRVEEYDQSRYLKDVLEMMGMDMLRNNLSMSRDSSDSLQSSSKIQLINSVKRLFDSRIASTMVSPSTSGKNYGSSYTKLRTLSPYNFNKSLAIAKYIRVYTIAVECTNDIPKIQHCADDAVCVALIVREAMMANKLNHKLDPANLLQRQSSEPQDNIMESSHSKRQFQELSRQVQPSLHGEQVLINWITKITLVHVEQCAEIEATVKVEHKSRFEDMVKAIFIQSNVHHVLLCLYTALMKVVDNKASDRSLEMTHILLAYGPYITYRLVYPALQGLEWQSGPEGIQSIAKTDVLPMRRDALVATSTPYYLVDNGSEIVFYQSLMRGDVLEGEKDGDDISQKDKQALNEKSKLQFIDYLITRLYEHPCVPRILVSAAGTASAVYFSSQFATDNSSNHYMISYDDFRMFILDILLNSGYGGNK